MSDTMQSSLLHRLRYTPMRDLLRGRVSGRLDWRHCLAAANLPAPASELIGRIVRRTRLWRGEKAAVADELIAHFLDGLEAGQSVQELFERFGDEKLAAKLIRRGKIRNRPLWWHVRRWLQWTLLALIAIYAGTIGYLCLGKPSPSVDYIAQINASILQTPEQDRAWPLYRTALIALRDTQASGQDWKELPTWLGYSIDGKHWPEMKAYCRQHAADLAVLRAATSKPALGFVLGPGGSSNDPALWPATYLPKLSFDASGGGAMIQIILPHLSEFRELAELLEVDAKLAAEDGDSNRLADDLRAALDMGKQMMGREGFLVEQLVGTGIFAYGLSTIDRSLSQHPELLSDAQWIGLAHAAAGPRVASDLIDLRGEQDAFRDLIQSMYTDDGHGDGHMTLQGLRFLKAISTPMGGGSRADEWWLAQLATPATLPLVASRKEILDQYDEYMREVKANLAGPIRNAQPVVFINRIVAWQQSSVMFIRYAPLLMLAPSLNKLGATAEISLGHRDGVLVGIALELYHRRHGQYPATLAELTPTFLPAVPDDRITGDPVKYRLKGGKPVVYSVGVNRIDDGGQLPAGGEPYYAAEWPDRQESIPQRWHGDWVLYPQPPAKGDPE